MAETAENNKEKDSDKKEGGTPLPESGSKISNTEWGIVIGALFLIDAVEIGIDFLFGIGLFTNPFIDILVNMAWPTYLHLRGVNLKSAKMLGTLVLGAIFQEVPGIDGIWGIEGLIVMFITKAEQKIKKETGVDVERLAAAAEGGEAGAAAGEAAGAGEAAAEGVAGGEAGAAAGDGANEEGGMSDDYADSMGQESDASGQEQESDNPYREESEEEKNNRMAGEEGDGDHEISDEDAENESKKNDSQSGENNDDKDKKKNKPQEKQGGRNNLFGGGRRGGGGASPSDSRNKNRYRSPEEKAEDERLSFHSNLLDLSDPYAERKKKENEESSHSE
ncbi:MAG: hypothetical protein Q7S86_04740 [bacterium]|nr:hypothetical protein [bacterium]